ncbi:hypothetical protein CDL12_16032 [Handroanthus impetiginosus]|uniref:Knottin scorpion toxin-like domain-containing protein n=1 Tax=Handroanthus impetiginosus TaxID=429701 RepID=A0A2G9H1H0_9LAMI|nr:hypothetical protein CDL12_16032 [Handroanthus impetiginosus]
MKVLRIVFFLTLMSQGNNHIFIEGALTCCHDNHIGRCEPGLDDPKCDAMCKEGCIKGGFCKVFHHAKPNHYCHCYC